MGEAMVTARMSSAKKEACNAVLRQLGTNASQAINELYDYVLEKRELPFAGSSSRRVCTQEDFAKAAAFVDGITTLPAGNCYATMSDEEIRQELLGARGLRAR